MARTGSSSKFVPVNLNNSYGQTLPLSNGGTPGSSGLGRSRSFSNSYGGMVSLSRPSKVTSSSSSSATVSRTSKLAVPRPVNLPSLRREHSGNDPTIALVGNLGSSGWNKQSGDESADVCASRSDALKGDSTSWGNRASSADGSSQPAERRLPSGSRQSTYSPPGPREAPSYGIPAAPAPIAKAVVFRGEDFPTLQAAAAPSSPSLPPPPRSRESQQKQRDKHPYEDNFPHQKEPSTGDDPQEPSHFFDRQLQPAQPVRMHARSTFSDQVDDDVERGSGYNRGPSPLIKLHHTSNWADDERETLSSVRAHESAQGEWGARNDGFHTAGNWMDRNVDIDFRRPTSRVGHSGRNEPDLSMHTVPASKTVYAKDGDSRRDYLDGGRFENNYRGDSERLINNLGRNELLKRGWSFPSAESNLNRDVRYASSNSTLVQDGYSNGRTYYREGNNARQDTLRRDMFSRDVRPGSQHQDGGQWQDPKFGKNVFIGKQAFPGGVPSSGPRVGRGTGFLYGGSDATLTSKAQPGLDYKREKRVSGYYGQVHSDDPFLGDGISNSPNAFYVSQPKLKKDFLNADDYRDPARESFEAELERVEKMLELKRQREIEERERAIELARKEQEEQERIVREEEELHLRLEEEAREAATRAQREAEEAERKVEEARKAREEEKRMAELEEERRKEAARRKLLELEERMAKRELEKRQEEERGSTRTVPKDVSMDNQESGPRKNETNRESHWKSLPSPGKLDQDAEQILPKAQVPGNTPLPSILRSPHLSPYVKEENGFPTEGGRLAQTWKRDSPISGHEPRSGHKGPPKFLHLRSDRSQQDSDEQQRGPLLRNISAHKSPARLNENRASEDADERDWWVRDTNRSLATYPQNSDLSEYPSYGRLRQSLPKQPRVLPPPPGNGVSRKQALQSGEIESEASVGATRYVEGPPPSFNEENSPTIGDESAEVDNQESLVVDVHSSEQFDAVPSEEVVLSDAGSQFSDDTIEDVVVQAEQDQELHSDVVSETYPDREVDEISDLTEAQESSEDGEPQKPADWEVDQNEDCIGDSIEEAKTEVYESSQGQPDVGRGGLLTSNETTDDIEGQHIAQNVDSSSLVEGVASANMEGSTTNTRVSGEAENQTIVSAEFKDGQEAARKAEELTPDKTLQDQEMHSFIGQTPFLPVATSDTAQVRHLEGVNARQSLVQQFQQPFSFMAVPLPQSGALNHVGAGLPPLSSMHTLPNQPELPFHLQLGILPSMPLMPNAIQIGSIQMPLHIHPQIPQLTHIHGHQQAPVFQFGQMGASLATISQPISITHMPPSPVQMLNVSGQNRSIEHGQLQAEVVGVEMTNINPVDCSGHGSLENVATVVATPIMSASQDSAPKEHAEVIQGPLGDNGGYLNTAEREIELPLVETQPERVATDAVSKLDGKIAASDKLDSDWIGEGDQNARPTGRPSRGGRRSNPPRYQGILGRGRGRFHGRGGHHYAYQGHQVSAENWPEGGAKRFSRGKMFRRNYRRAEYRVREPIPLFDQEAAAPDSFSGSAPNAEETKESGGYRYVKRGPGGHTSGDENGQPVAAVSHSLSQITANSQPASQNAAATSTKAKSLLRKYEVDNAEDAPLRTGIVRVFDQPGIETPNDKDDFIKVRSKRQLLRELREQREKESKIKVQDLGSKDQVAKKQQRSSAKVGASSGTVTGSSSKNVIKRRSTRYDGKPTTPSSSNGISSATPAKRNLMSSKVGRTTSASKAVIVEPENYANDNYVGDHTTPAAWGGQRSNQEVVSLTQIQLEEAMKPFRLDVPFPESVRSPEKAVATLEPGLPCSSSLSVEKTITSAKAAKASGPLSSLLAGEKIQFGAVTSPTLMPPENRSPTPVSAVRTGSPIDFGSDPPRISSHSSSFVTGFLDSHLDATFSLKGDSARKDDGYEVKVVDLEAEAAAEAAASAVVAAAISSEDPIDNHSNTRTSEMNVGCTSISSGSSVSNAMSGQGHSNCVSDNPIAVALPADLSVETPPSLFQGSSMTLSNSSGVMLQSLQGGAPTFPCLEMGPLIGGPVFNFGPREDASMVSMEPGLSGWQQRHVGTPDSFYGAPPFLSPAGLSSIQGHPHMLVYTNPYTPVGQFGQLGVSFMGAAYHPSGKQPDWTHVPLPSASSGGLAMNDGDLTVGSNGLMASQHHNGASNLIHTQRAPISGSSVMSVAAAPNLFDTGFGAPFQVPQMDGLVQSHWSKAPAPPIHNVSAAGSTLPLPLSRSGVDLNLSHHPPKVQGGHLTNYVDANSGFHQMAMMTPVTAGSSFSTIDASPQFPDELGLGDSLPTVSNLQSDVSRPLSDMDHLNSTVPMEGHGMRLQRGRRPSQGSQGHLNSANGSHTRELMSSSNYQEENRGGFVAAEGQGKSVSRIGSPGVRGSSMQIQEQRVSKQAVPRDNAGGEWVRGGSQRKGATGRISTSERGGSSVPSKLKQIYVAKPAGDSRKLGAACS